MTNFDFLAEDPRWASLTRNIKRAESRVRTDPASAARLCRIVLEECLHRIYGEEQLDVRRDDTIDSLLRDGIRDGFIDLRFRSGLDTVRRTGNLASHFSEKNTVNRERALVSIRHLYDFLKWFAGKYSRHLPDLPDLFIESYVPKAGQGARKRAEAKKEFEKQKKELAARVEAAEVARLAAEEKARQSAETLAAYQAEIAARKARLALQKAERPDVKPAEYTEADTRLHLIDAALAEAGWHDLRDGKDKEYPVTGMPLSTTQRGKGFVDYVLWNDDGLPLALIEAKRSAKDADLGRKQARLYADCLEREYGQRPVLFYTNGYETFLWDDTFYTAPRRVYGFYTKEELQWMLERRKTRRDFRNAPVNPDIADRAYQKIAIERVAETFITDGTEGIRGKKRKALLVMATGSGKTRTAAALCEILFSHAWVHKILFLADRNALTKQAKDSFKEHLKDYGAVNLGVRDPKDPADPRITFSTYQTMINRIDNAYTETGKKYGVGHFDLIIIDEAHRSIYNRYQAIFHYFDALLVGLTATPKQSIDHDTFNLFECERDDPTFSYELDEATPLYLKPYQNLDVSTEFIREGIKYSKLSEADRIEYEKTFADPSTGLFPDEIESGAMNKWLFNKDTVDKVLQTLMRHGLKIEGGDKLGRTIIFVPNQARADYVVERFEALFPEMPAGFIEKIYTGIPHIQDTIDKFCDHKKENLPQIAVSVDMMDTGIDAPRVLNLVFFKVVRSYAKFWQMIGRGTRLCPDVFGPGEDKEFFLIFDVGQNFAFFEINQRGTETTDTKPRTRQIFEARLQLSRLLAETGEEENLTLAEELLDKLHAVIVNLPRNEKGEYGFLVKMNLRYVEEYQDRARWNNLSSADVADIKEYLSPLPAPEGKDEPARVFELRMLKLQIARLLKLAQEAKHVEYCLSVADALSTKYTIPPVKRAKETIEKMRKPDFYVDLTQRQLDKIREEIKDLVIHLKREKTVNVFADIQDSDVSLIARDGLVPYTYETYKKRVERFLQENKQDTVIAKLSTNKPITAAELQHLENILFENPELGTREDFENTYGKEPLGTFVRSILGLDSAAAQEAFAEFLNAGNLTADQMTFINNIVNYLTHNGQIEVNRLFESPFTAINPAGLGGVFEKEAMVRIIGIVEEVNGNAVA